VGIQLTLGELGLVYIIFAKIIVMSIVTCEGSVANLQCGQVIVVYWADFGRRDTTTCSDHRPKHEIQNVQCLNPTTKVADSCNGKSSCAIEASCSVFGDPCVGTYKYLEVAYDCQCKCLTLSSSSENGQVITIHWAYFGRRDTTTCSYQRPDTEIQNVHCLNPTPKVSDSCNGKSSCAIEASCSVFGDPCPGTYKYLEVAYDCQCKCLQTPLQIFEMCCYQWTPETTSLIVEKLQF
uniref:SUEL-type lectin domain-containing protein n=1 Tax=Amphilophus citrinellus TaxID=61819 RepID=A0A3Q0RJF1_AMPCI